MHGCMLSCLSRVSLQPLGCGLSGSSVHGDSPGKNTVSGLPCSPPGDFPDPGIKPTSLKSPALVGRFFTTSATWEALILPSVQFSSVQSLSCVLWPHESQHARPPSPSQTPGVYSNSRPSNRWSHPAISSSVVPFSSCPQSLSASGYFPMRTPYMAKVLEFQLQH